jgi:hypothetical protein
MWKQNQCSKSHLPLSTGSLVHKIHDLRVCNQALSFSMLFWTCYSHPLHCTTRTFYCSTVEKEMITLKKTRCYCYEITLDCSRSANDIPATRHRKYATPYFHFTWYVGHQLSCDWHLPVGHISWKSLLFLATKEHLCILGSYSCSYSKGTYCKYLLTQNIWKHESLFLIISSLQRVMCWST